MKKFILSGACALALVGSLAQAQTATTTQSTTTTTGAGGTVRETTTTTDTTSGVVTDFTPGTSVILKTEAAAPVTYTKFSKTMIYTDESGKIIEPTLVRRDSRVRVHYSKVGSDMVVDKVIVLK